VLGMPRSATADDIRKSFRRLAKTLHPDVNRSDPEAAARFAELNSAHEILSNRAKRGAFDRGEIDARGRPAYRASARRRRARSTVRHIVMCLAIAVPIFSVTSTLIARGLTASGVVITNGDRKGNPLSRFGVSDAQGSAVGASGAARMVVASR